MKNRLGRETCPSNKAGQFSRFWPVLLGVNLSHERGRTMGNLFMEMQDFMVVALVAITIFLTIV